MSTDRIAADARTASETAARQKRLTVRVRREQALDSGAWVWTGLPEGCPGSAGGRTVAELFAEVDALKHFMMDEDPTTEIAVDYMYDVADFPVSVLIDYHHGRAARDKAAEDLRRANDELITKARATASALRAAGLSVRDGAALMGLSKSRFDQLTA
jgi:hypothetical protein